MMKVAQNTLKEVDLILFMVNAEEGFGRGEEFILKNSKQSIHQSFLLLIKLIKFTLMNYYRLLIPIKKNILLKKSFLYLHLKEIMLIVFWSKLKHFLPEGPQYYPADQVTDHPERFIIYRINQRKSPSFNEGRNSPFSCCSH